MLWSYTVVVFNVELPALFELPCSVLIVLFRLIQIQVQITSVAIVAG